MGQNLNPLENFSSEKRLNSIEQPQRSHFNSRSWENPNHQGNNAAWVNNKVSNNILILGINEEVSDFDYPSREQQYYSNMIFVINLNFSGMESGIQLL